ncbi:MAG: type I methionyl aminopeptidase [Chloroflexi bacterium]|nr:type I methionyl aminopeptidase [Chloroflexota bacterium]
MRVVQPRIQHTGIIVKSDDELAIMRRAGQVVARTLEALLDAVRPGITTGELDALAYEVITSHGAIPSFKGYRGFPASICTSLNEEVVHGIPGKRVVREGDILGLDCGAIVEGYHGDSAVTVGVGEISEDAQRLLTAAEGSLDAAIEQTRVGRRMGDLSWAAQQVAEAQGFGVVKEYVGHGIGRELHEEPAVPNFGTPGRGILLQKGLVLAIEPMVNMGTWKTRLMPDEWTVVTEDGTLSAHFEHTIAITEDGPEVFTARKR